MTYAEQEGYAPTLMANTGLAAAVHCLLVLFHKAEAIGCSSVSPTRVTRTLRSICRQIVVDGHGLGAVLDLVDQVALQLLDAQNREHIVRIDRTVDERIASAYALALLQR